MGWNSDTTWDLTFHSQEALGAFLAEVQAHAAQQRWPVGDLVEDMESGVAAAVELCGETDPDCVILDGLHLTANTWGKWYGDDILAMLARHADGTVDFPYNDEAQPFRLRLHAGQISRHDGQIIYPGDPGAMPLTEAQARAIVTAIQAGEVDALDLRVLVSDPGGWIEQSSTGVASQLRAAREHAPATGGAPAHLTQPATAPATAPASPAEAANRVLQRALATGAVREWRPGR